MSNSKCMSVRIAKPFAIVSAPLYLYGLMCAASSTSGMHTLVMTHRLQCERTSRRNWACLGLPESLFLSISDVTDVALTICAVSMSEALLSLFVVMSIISSIRSPLMEYRSFSLSVLEVLFT